MTKDKISSTPSIRRLPSYLNIIRHYQGSGDGYISGTVIAQELNLEPIQVRKDLAITGIIGKPKKGYAVDALIAAIEHFLGWDKVRTAILVGAGNLGSALMGYQEFKRHGLNVIAAFDSDPSKDGAEIHGVKVFPMTEMERKIGESNVKTAILTVPSPFAQATSDILVKSGVEAIWNFTNVKLKIPDKVVMQREDLSSGYALLCVMLQRKAEKDQA
jgi:redox-sensing transcriptional repressor